MPGKTLSRWTLLWFGTAFLCLLAALVLALADGVGPGAWSGAVALATVHLFVLGWLGQMMLGALLQFAPVLAARPLAYPRLALPALMLCCAGILTLVAGFMSLDGHEAARALFVLAPVLLGLGFGTVAVMLAATLVSRATLRLAAVRMVLLALIGMAGVWASGAGMVWALSGIVDGDPARILPLHILLGAGAFLSFAAFGVSYKLFAMFLLTADTDSWQRQVVFGLSLVALVMLLAGLAGLATAPAVTVMTIAISGIYSAEAARLWRARRRPRPEINMSWSRAALGFLLLAALLPAIRPEAAVFAAIVGWLSTLTLAQALKITGFLTWIQVYAPQIGRHKVPVVQALGDPVAAGRALALWSGAAAFGTLALLAQSTAGFRLALCGLLLAALVIVRELVAIRQLSHLPRAERPAHLPPLLLPPSPLPRPKHDPAPRSPA